MGGPVEISPPTGPAPIWLIKSQADNRPLRATVAIDAGTGREVMREGFADRHWIDRAVGYGVAAHEGALFGWVNQLLGLLTAIALMLLSVSSFVLWWHRRPTGQLGAPPLQGRVPHSGPIVVLVVALGMVMPLFGISLAAVVAIDFLLVRRSIGVRRWLGLAAY